MMDKERETKGEFYQKLVEEVNDGIAVIQDGKVVFANTRAAQDPLSRACYLICSLPG